MSDQDFEGLPKDLISAIRAAAESFGPSSVNTGRIYDGCIWVTAREWDIISKDPESTPWSELTQLEKLRSLPLRVIFNDRPQTLSDGRIMFAFNDVLYLFDDKALNYPPLPRLHIDGVYI